MRRAIIAFALLVLAGIAIIGGAVYIRNKRAGNDTPSIPPPTVGEEKGTGVSSSFSTSLDRSLADCAAYARALDRYTCFSAALSGSTDEASCGAVAAAAKDDCLAVVLSVQAAASGDRSLCDRITNPMHQSLCRGGDDAPDRPDLSAQNDADKDGLLDSDEAKYGTDVYEPDTDGDGFADGEEVKNGFNPNGPGNI